MKKQFLAVCKLESPVGPLVDRKTQNNLGKWVGQERNTAGQTPTVSLVTGLLGTWLPSVSSFHLFLQSQHHPLVPPAIFRVSR